MSGGFFRGTSFEQDTRFSNKTAKLLKTHKFPPELDQLVDMNKVKMDVMRPWIATKVTQLLGFEDEVLINFIYGMLEGQNVDGKQIQIQLTGFMEKNTVKFMRELWSLLTSAQSNISGIPQQFLDQKVEEARKHKAEDQRIVSEFQKKQDGEQKRSEKLNVALDEARRTMVKTTSTRSTSRHYEERLSDGLRAHVKHRRTVSRSSRSRSRGDPVHSSRSVSRSPYLGKRHRSRSVSRSPQLRRLWHSRSSPRRGRSPTVVRSPRRWRLPAHSRSPHQRRNSPIRRSLNRSSKKSARYTSPRYTSMRRPHGGQPFSNSRRRHAPSLSPRQQEVPPSSLQQQRRAYQSPRWQPAQCQSPQWYLSLSKSPRQQSGPYMSPSLRSASSVSPQRCLAPSLSPCPNGHLGSSPSSFPSPEQLPRTDVSPSRRNIVPPSPLACSAQRQHPSTCASPLQHVVRSINSASQTHRARSLSPWEHRILSPAPHQLQERSPPSLKASPPHIRNSSKSPFPTKILLSSKRGDLHNGINHKREKIAHPGQSGSTCNEGQKRLHSPSWESSISEKRKQVGVKLCDSFDVTLRSDELRHGNFLEEQVSLVSICPDDHNERSLVENDSTSDIESDREEDDLPTTNIDEARKAAKKLRREAKRQRKEKRRRKRAEKQMGKEERRAVKAVARALPSPGDPNNYRHNTGSGHFHGFEQGLRSEEDDIESEYKVLENLRKKALNPIRARKAVSS